jgi:hypothetical protein
MPDRREQERRIENENSSSPHRGLYQYWGGIRREGLMYEQKLRDGHDCGSISAKNDDYNLTSREA